MAASRNEKSKEDGPARSGTPVSVWLPDPAGQILHFISKQEDRKLTAVIVRALKAYCEANEIPWKMPDGFKSTDDR